ncbi:hypothetical protein [uncultured Umboniibacter sp.]|uniref:hypothetical protein n=1 Tax=uncultured Umboniibacter sp. TaxID=1798917 RepID=UPI002610C792|nr:hypothetical protein [uncultured Umboniibacter sp.]
MNDIQLTQLKSEFNEIKQSVDESCLYEGFSLRFNQLLDFSDLDIPYLGRSSWLTQIMGWTGLDSGGRLHGDSPPTPKRLFQFAFFMTNHINLPFTEPTALSHWLLSGQDNRFEPISMVDSMTNLVDSYVGRYYKRYAPAPHKRFLEVPLNRQAAVKRIVVSFSVDQLSFTGVYKLSKKLVHQKIENTVNELLDGTPHNLINITI